MKSYQIQFCGDCLGDLIPNGSMLLAEPAAPIAPMDIVSIVLNRVDGPFGQFMNAMGADFVGVCKLYLGSRAMPDGEMVHLVAQLSPPALSPIPASAIEAMHRVVDGQFPSEPRAGDEVSQALALLAPFAGGEPCQPINPAWSPASYGKAA